MRNQTLGPFGKATVILFTAQFDSELPKLAEMKRFLKIPDGKYYRSHGHHSDLCNKIESLIHIHRNPSEEQDNWYRDRVELDHAIEQANTGLLRAEAKFKQACRKGKYFENLDRVYDMQLSSTFDDLQGSCTDRFIYQVEDAYLVEVLRR